MSAVGIIRSVQLVIALFSLVIGLRAQRPAVRMLAPLGVMGLVTTTYYALMGSVSDALLISMGVIGMGAGAVWLLALGRQVHHPSR